MVRKNAPVLKKNVYGYYPDPQFHNNQPNLVLTKHPNIHKAMQTIPEDLSVVSIKPIIKLTVIDGRFKPQRNRHRIDFYVRLNYNQECELFVRSSVQHMNLKATRDDIQHTF